MMLHIHAKSWWCDTSIFYQDAFSELYIHIIVVCYCQAVGSSLVLIIMQVHTLKVLMQNTITPDY